MTNSDATHDDSFQPTIDMLLNITVFMWFGAVCPWPKFLSNGVIPFARLLPLGALVLLFRRLPWVLAVHSFIPQIEEWKQAIFVGFFGPIGVSAIFYLYIAVEFVDELVAAGRSDLEKLSEIIFVVVWFLVICSIVIHGLTIPLGKLGFYIPQTLTIDPNDPNEPLIRRRVASFVIATAEALTPSSRPGTPGSGGPNGNGSGWAAKSALPIFSNKNNNNSNGKGHHQRYASLPLNYGDAAGMARSAPDRQPLLHSTDSLGGNGQLNYQPRASSPLVPQGMKSGGSFGSGSNATAVGSTVGGFGNVAAEAQPRLINRSGGMEPPRLGTSDEAPQAESVLASSLPTGSPFRSPGGGGYGAVGR